MARGDGADPRGDPAEQDAATAPARVSLWRDPVFSEKFCGVPAFLLPRLAEMAAEAADHPLGRRIFYERAHCLLVLASSARRTDPASYRLDEPPSDAERDLGSLLGQAFHQGCSLADAALATGFPASLLLAIGKRTIRRKKWLSRIADPGPDTRAAR